jgi:hypothetical protein
MNKYNFGIQWSPEAFATVGLKHESLNDKKLEIGKLKLFIHHIATPYQTIGSEFSLDWQRRNLEAQIGLLHKFDAFTSAKVKADHHGFVNALLQHRISPNLAVALSAGVNVKSDSVEKARMSSLPFGISLEVNI